MARRARLVVVLRLLTRPSRYWSIFLLATEDGDWKPTIATMLERCTRLWLVYRMMEGCSAVVRTATVCATAT